MVLEFFRNTFRAKQDGRDRRAERHERIRHHQQDDRRNPCHLCKGLGECHRCHGEAFLFSGGKRDHCFECQGSGQCGVCDGSGYR